MTARHDSAAAVKGARLLLDVLYAEVNIVGAAFLLFMFTSKYSNKFREITFDQQVFNILIMTNICILLFDTGMWIIDGASFAGAKVINQIISCVYYLLCTAMCVGGIVYADCRIYENKPALLKRLRFYCIPAVISAVMALVTPFIADGWLFTINDENIYTRGKFFWVFTVISFFYLIVPCGMAIWDIIKNGWEKNKNNDLPLLIFFVPVIISTIVQVKYYGMSLIWITCALVCGYNFINVQNCVISTDYITGLNNRRRFDLYLQRKIQSWKGDGFMFALILDMDDFKRINDDYGHMSGDLALYHAADILRRSCRNGLDFIARMGGDEFIIMGERADIDEIEFILTNINANITEFNSRRLLKFDISLSMGYSVFKKGDTAESLIESADKKMYVMKQKHKISA